MRPTKERRSDATRIRQMRRLLSMCRDGFRMVFDHPSALASGYARDMVRMINDELAPRARKETSDGR